MDLRKGLVGAWWFKDGHPMGTTPDWAGYNRGRYIGTLTSGLTKVSSRYGPVLLQDVGGSNDEKVGLGSITSDNPLSLAGLSESTVLWRAKIPSGGLTNTFPRVIDKSNSGNAAEGWGIWFGESAGSYSWAAKSGSPVTEARASTAVTRNVWESWAHRVSGSNLNTTGNHQFFKDGGTVGHTQPQSGAISAYSSTTTNAAIANWNHTSGRQWDGWIDYIYVYNRPLTDAEIRYIQLVEPYAPILQARPGRSLRRFEVITGGTAYELAADPGSFAVSGTDAALEFGYALDADAGSYSVSGTDAQLEFGFALDAEAGSFTISGTDAALEHDKILSAEAGSYTITGTDATLTYSGTDKTLTAEAGSFAISGTDAQLEFGYALDADTGSYTISGTDADLNKGQTLNAEAGSFTISGTDVSLEYGRAVDADPGSYSITGNDADLIYSGDVEEGRVGDGGGGGSGRDDWEEHQRLSEWAAKRILEEARLEALKEAEQEAEKAQNVGVREQRKIIARIREDLADAVRDDITKSRIEVTDVRRGLSAITSLLDERKRQKTRPTVLRYFEDIQTVIGQRIAEQEQRIEELAQDRHARIYEQNQIALRMMEEDRQQTSKRIKVVGEKLLSMYGRK